jgi:beta-lactamase superfamily II metal-dependent hydrolase
MAYQVDFFPVGEGSKSGDAIAIRFGDFSDYLKTQVVVIDGGFQSSGEALVKHIREVYGTTYVDLVVSTHPDSDHSAGLAPVIEELKVGQLWMHKPWEHTYDIAKMFQDGRVTDMSVAEGIRKSLEDVRYLEKLAKQKNITIIEPFTGLQDVTQSLTVLGPTKAFYESLLPDFRCTPAPKFESNFTKLASAGVGLAVKVAETLGIETLVEPTEGTHAENNSSVITLFQHGQECILFTADAGVPALEQACSQLEAVGFDFNRLRIVQIPHHGSKRNVGPKILDRILGPKQCASPKSHLAKVIDAGVTAGHATRDVSHRTGGHGDPIGIGGASRRASRGARPAPPVGRPRAFESAVSHTRPSAVAVLAQGLAAMARCAAAGSAGHRRPLASRWVRSALVAAFAASGETTHRFADSRSDSALGRRKSPLGCAAHPRRVTEAGNCRLGTHGVALPA